MHERTLRVEVRWGDGAYWAQVPDLAGCVASAVTLDQLRSALIDAIEACITPVGDYESSIRVRLDGLTVHVQSDLEVRSRTRLDPAVGRVRTRDPHSMREASVAWQRRWNELGHSQRPTTSLDPDAEPADVDEEAVAAYQRMMDAETVAYALWERAGHNLQDWDALTDSGPEGTEWSLWLSDLGRKITALGGRLEVAAVFAEHTITLMSEPGSAPQADASIE